MRNDDANVAHIKGANYHSNRDETSDQELENRLIGRISRLYQD